MQCIHFVKVEPASVDDGFLTLVPHYSWLKQNGIKRFRSNNKISYSDDRLDSCHVTFRFADIEDATAFKLRWS